MGWWGEVEWGRVEWGGVGWSGVGWSVGGGGGNKVTSTCMYKYPQSTAEQYCVAMTTS